LSKQFDKKAASLPHMDGSFNHIRPVAPICIPSNTCFLGPTRVHNPNGISIGSAVYAELMIVADTPTDRQTTLLHL